jgi:hypothetical protein
MKEDRDNATEVRYQNNQNGVVSYQQTTLMGGGGGGECSLEAVNLWMCDRLGVLILYKSSSLVTLPKT